MRLLLYSLPQEYPLPGTVELDDRENYELKPYVKNPAKYVMMPAMANAGMFLLKNAWRS